MTDGVSYGLLRRDGLHLALPLAILREVLPRPDRLEQLPHDLPGLVGAHVLRGRVIPVVDLSSLVSGQPEDDRQEIIAVLRHGSAVLGVLADAAEGIVSVAAAARTTMQGSRSSVASTVFHHDAVDGVVSVLDVASLFDRFGEVAITVASDADMNAVHGTADSGLVAGQAWAGGDLPVLLTRCDELRIGIPIGTVDGMQTTTAIEPSALEGGSCLGVIDYRDTWVPLVDPLRLLGLGRTTVQPMNECLVMALDGGFVALLISEVIQLAHVDPATVQAVPGFGFTRPDALRGLWDGGVNGRVLLMRTDLLTTDEDLQALARMNTSVSAVPDVVEAVADDPTAADGMTGVDGLVDDADVTDQVDGEVDRETRTYVTVDCGVEIAALLHEIDAIVDVSDDLVRYETTSDWIAGMFTYRDRMVPMVHLPVMVGQQVTGTAGEQVVLVIDGADGAVGFMVNRLLSIEPSSSLIREGQVPSAGGCAPVPLDTVPYAVLDADDRMVPVLDLRALCTTITAGLLAA
jgi:purine-binding chemotaxis protein CheW